MLKWGPVIQAAGSVLAAGIIAWGAINAAARSDPKFVRVGDHVINIDHLVEIARHDVGDGCKIITSNSGSRFVQSPDGHSFTQQFAGHDVDGASCDVLLRRAARGAQRLRDRRKAVSSCRAPEFDSVA